MHRDTNGFTLLELMIVIAIIAIIAAIAIPNLRDARISANEASAIAVLRSMHAAQQIYREQDVDGNGTLDYGLWANLESAGLMPIEQGADYNGYSFTHKDVNSAGLFQWCNIARPIVLGVSGTRYFAIQADGVIRYKDYDDGAWGGYVFHLWTPIGK